MITGEEKPDNGDFKVGETVKVSGPTFIVQYNVMFQMGPVADYISGLGGKFH